jgi:hypothetical protein
MAGVEKWKALAAGVVMMLAANGVASAALMKAVYTGTIKDGGYDNTGEFGTEFHLSGGQFTATFVYDTTLGEQVSSDPQLDHRDGGLATMWHSKVPS